MEYRSLVYKDILPFFKSNFESKKRNYIIDILIRIKKGHFRVMQITSILGGIQ